MLKRTRPISLFLANVLALVVALACPSHARGQSDAGGLFRAKCGVCHGANGDANTEIGRNMKLRDLRSAEVQKYTDAQLATIICCGKGRMIGYASRFTDDQVMQLVHYMRALAAAKKP